MKSTEIFKIEFEAKSKDMIIYLKIYEKSLSYHTKTILPSTMLNRLINQIQQNNPLKNIWDEVKSFKMYNDELLYEINLENMENRLINILDYQPMSNLKLIRA
jgi:hypothetical protein